MRLRRNSPPPRSFLVHCHYRFWRLNHSPHSLVYSLCCIKAARSPTEEPVVVLRLQFPATSALVLSQEPCWELQFRTP